MTEDPALTEERRFRHMIPDRSAELAARSDTHHIVAALRAQPEQLVLALESISVGVCIFDRTLLLIFSNRRYAQIYGIAPDAIRPGLHLSEVIALRALVGAVPDMSVPAYLGHVEGQSRIAPGSATVVELKNGRSIAIRHDPMPDGGYVATHEDITERRLAELRATYVAQHDTLTGLPNRIMLRERLEESLAEACSGRPCAVIRLDLDNFKLVNDDFGYSLGDAALRDVAARLGAALGPADMLARISGDEFAIVQRGQDQPGSALELADRLLHSLSNPLHINGQSVSLGGSIGIAIAPDDGRDADSILRHADLALADAKAAGRGRASLFTAPMDAAAQHRRALELDLRKAVSARDLALVFQPIVNLQTGRVTGFEALMRWDRPQFGRVSPAEFIPLAEDNGLILELGAWVLMQACSEAARWPRWLKVSVNVSPAQFRAPGLYEAVVAALDSSGIAPGRLKLEITESAMMENWADTSSVLRRIKQLGVRVALDDFGTGYSSLSYLRKFPFDKIKIDQAFIRELAPNSESVAIVRAIIALCGALAMGTTAEGVETQEQMDILMQEGCTEVQGYLLSPPVPPNQIPALLERLDTPRPATPPVRRPMYVPEPREVG